MVNIPFCRNKQILSFSVAEFVKQSSDAATGAASITVDDAGKFYR